MAPRGLRASIAERVAAAGWIKSPAFDFFLLIAAPLVTVPIMAGVYFKIPLLAIVAALTLAFSHYWSTLAFYFWEDSRAYHRQRWVAFYAGPVVLAAVYLALVAIGVPYFVQFMLFFWNTWHVARQNCGILSLYRTRAGVRDPSQKSAANDAIIAISLFLCLWNIGTHHQVSALFGLISPGFVHAVTWAAGIAAGLTVLRLIVALVRRREAVGLPEALFLITGLVFFYPYFLMRDSNYATLIMLLPHYVQYLALVWLLHRRKFAGAAGGAPQLLAGMSAKLVILVPILIVVGYSFSFLRDVASATDTMTWWNALYLLIAFEHFYLDGLIWSFRREHARSTILPHLVGR
ncbi:hypothetical protein [Sphingomonas antarctica]|uniref:hypothetical protein n=1 Tax=Sphingomonas antarctica TaxID=2040274 RepID=UPI0039EC0749